MSGLDKDQKQKSERRKAPRIPLCLATAAGCDAWMSICHTKDISESGIFLISQRIPNMTADFSIELQLPSPLGFIRQAAVVIRAQHDNPRGFALVWKNLTQDNASALSNLKQRWESAFNNTELSAGSKM